jgi:hypothetical protein
MWWLDVEAAEGWPTEAAFGPEYTPFRYRAAAPDRIDASVAF